MKRFTFILFLLPILSVVRSQTTTEQRIEQLKTTVPPSPNVSSLGKYGDWPTNLYTGLPNINIPICDVKSRSNSFPISLSYHSAGHKVGEIASWVGLGWSLNAGGVISRVVKGIPDETPTEGYFEKTNIYSNPNDFGSMPLNIDAATQHKVYSARQTYYNCNGCTWPDSEQDIYSFNALGKSFKFLIKANGEVIPIPYNNVKISTNLIGSNGDVFWNVILEDGTKLYFGGSGYTEMTYNPRFYLASNHYPSAWVLKKVVYTNGEVVDFNYKVLSILQDSYFSESDFLSYNGSYLGGVPLSNVKYMDSDKKRLKSEKQEVMILQLSSIETDLSRLDFIPNNALREDIKGGESLDCIKLFSKLTNAFIESYKFNYSYSISISSNEFWGGVLESDKNFYRKRLILGSLLKSNFIDSGTTNKWKFSYNPQLLPSRRSYAQDHWGFFNGEVTNNSLLPDFFYPLPNDVFAEYGNAGFNPNTYNKGGNREGNGEFAKAQILEKIEYPTSGSTQFIFEANSIHSTKEFFTDKILMTDELNLNASSSPYTTSLQKTFSITKPQNIKLILDAYISNGIFNDRPNARVSASVIEFSTQRPIGGLNSSHQSNLTTYFNLISPGTYILKISTNVGQESFGESDAIFGKAILEFQESLGIQDYNQNIGGLRLKKTYNYDAITSNAILEKEYVYENPLIISPINIIKDYFTETEEEVRFNERIDNDANGNEICNFSSYLFKRLTRNSATKFSLGSIQGGNTVGYGKVTTLIGSMGKGGTIISEFNNQSDYGEAEAHIFPYPSVDSKDARRGLLLKETSISNYGSKISEKTSIYQFLPKQTINSFKAGVFTSYLVNPPCNNMCPVLYRDCGIQKISYATTSEEIRILATTNKVFSQNGIDFSSSTTNYYYDNPFYTQPSRIVTSDSKMNVITAITKFPYDFVNNPVYAEMINRNIINMPVEQKKINTTLNKEINSQKINYSFWGNNNMIEPSTIQSSLNGGSYTTDFEILKYSEYSNVMEFKGKDGIIGSYLWAYNNTYPVAKIIGSTYNNAISQSNINLTYLNSLTDDNAIRIELNKLRNIPNAFITTYTYKPLVGITSETDANGKTTYYEYDSFNRLKHIKDKDGNILKVYDYKYKATPNQ